MLQLPLTACLLIFSLSIQMMTASSKLLLPEKQFINKILLFAQSEYSICYRREFPFRGFPLSITNRSATLWPHAAWSNLHLLITYKECDVEHTVRCQIHEHSVTKNTNTPNLIIFQKSPQNLNGLFNLRNVTEIEPNVNNIKPAFSRWSSQGLINDSLRIE